VTWHVTRLAGVRLPGCLESHARQRFCASEVYSRPGTSWRGVRLL